MKALKHLLFRTCLLLLILIGIGGCLAATPWPHRGLMVDLAKANVSKSDVGNVIQKFLISNGFSNAGKAGYDLINNTNTVVDFNGPDKLIVSIQMDANGVVPVYFNQNRKMFTPQAINLFDRLEVDLNKRWPNAVDVIK